MDHEDQTIGAAINRTAKLLRRLADRRLAPLGLSSGYLPVLTALIGRDGQTQAALTAHAGIEQPTMAVTLTRMERDGVIERRADPEDRRRTRFFMTKETLERLPEIRTTISALNAAAVAGLSAGEEAQLRQSLAKVYDEAAALLADGRVGAGSET